jgi:hypothetical protein
MEQLQTVEANQVIADADNDLSPQDKKKKRQREWIAAKYVAVCANVRNSN